MAKTPRRRPSSDYIELSKRQPIVSPDPSPRRDRKRGTLSLTPPQLRSVPLPDNPKLDFRIEKRARYLQENPALILTEEINAPLSSGHYDRRRQMAQEFTKLEPEPQPERSCREREPLPDDLAFLSRFRTGLPHEPDPSARPRILPLSSPYVARKREPQPPPPRDVLRAQIAEAEAALAKLGKQQARTTKAKLETEIGGKTSREYDDELKGIHGAIQQIHGKLDKLGRQMMGEWL